MKFAVDPFPIASTGERCSAEQVANEALPHWFQVYDWDISLDYFANSFLPADMGLTDFNAGSFTVKISGSARAIPECLYLTPKHQERYECHEFMQGLNISLACNL